MKVLFILALAYASSAMAAPSLLGLCHPKFNCNGVKSLYAGQERIILSYLENTFGERCKCANELLSDPRPKTLRVHLIQSVCMRNKRCGRYEALWGYTVASASRAALNPKSRLRKRFSKILARFKARIEGVDGLTCYVSPCLECDLYEKPRRVLAGLVSDTLPTCNIVDNPYRRRCLPGTICEKHGPTPKLAAPCIVDLDGVDGNDVDVKEWVEKYKHCDLQFYWELWMNCIRGDFIDPRKRNCSYPKSVFTQTKDLLCQYYSQLFATCLP